jgi:hypothetical protein
MGAAGILPVTMKNGKLHFLLGKENQYEKSAPGFSDFGGGGEKNESHLETAIREGGEELTGFLGSDDQLRKMLNASGPYTIDIQNGKYRTHVFYMKYDPQLVKYYNNNQKFIQKRLDPAVIKSSKIFEKAEIQWICIDDLNKMRSKFRHFFTPMVDEILQRRDEIEALVKKNGTRKHR